MKILVLNAGSSSLKYSLFVGEDSHLACHGLIEHLGESEAEFESESESEQGGKSHLQALQEIETQLRVQNLASSLGDCEVVAHRVVHGGEAFAAPTLINDEVIYAIEKLSELAPLHNPANLAPIKAIREHFPQLPQVAVFDTAFHQTMPDYAFRYAIPNAFYEQHQIRRYGFHGSSHQYITQRLAQHLNKPACECNLISLHLGNGASICAIQQGKSIDTTMGFTPLEGVIMGTRSGDLDPAIPLYMMRHLNLTTDQVDEVLNKHSGLLGISGHNDMRDIEADAKRGDDNAMLALAMFAYRINKLVGGYLAITDKLDAIVFTGGIGEHGAQIRELIVNGFSSIFGLDVDESVNNNLSSFGNEVAISSGDSQIPIWVIPTNEEWQIAQHAMAVLANQ